MGVSKEMSTPGIGIIGCGLIGKKRALATPNMICGLYDIDSNRSQKLAEELNQQSLAAKDLNTFFSLSQMNIVVVAVQNNGLSELAEQALKAKKNVLVEKPGALNSQQWKDLCALANKQGRKIRIGYNHRYHPAILKAREIVDSGTIGPLFMIRARYGHGGRKGYESEWRADKKLSGGGELMDQGVHLIDLAQWFLGPFSKINGSVKTYFWDMKVDDNAFMHLETATGATAWLHASCTEWKNTFSMEIYGKRGKLLIDGLGGSYGIEKLHFYQMDERMVPPQTLTYEYPKLDSSWAVEMADFIDDIRLDRVPVPGPKEGLHALEIVETLYKESGVF